jgi:hypothetical protein
MRTIDAVLRAGAVPGTDGFFRADGTSRRVEYGGPELPWFELGPPLEPDAWDDDDIEELDPAVLADLPNGQGAVCCGEGSLGADGFFARRDAAGNLIWVVFMTRSNPFCQVEVTGMAATFINNLGNSVVIDLNDPDFA